MNAATNEEPKSLDSVSVSAAFGSLLPWMTQAGHFEIDELQTPSGKKGATPADGPVHDEITLAALDISERLLRQFFDDSPISVAVFDSAGRLLHVNRAFGAMLGYPAEDLMARNIDELMHPDDVPSMQERRRLLLEGKCDAFQIETRFGTADRQEVWTRVCGRLEQHEDGQPPHIFAHIVDFTELEHALEVFRRDAEEARWKNWDPDRYMD